MGTPWWRPKNETEQAMATALRHQDATAYFQAVVAAELYLPQFEDHYDGRHSPVTRDFGTETALLVYTSIESMQTILDDEADTYTTVRYADLRAQWPAPDVRLAINYGYPISAYVPVPAVSRVVSGQLTVVENRLVSADDAEPIAGLQPVFDPAAAKLLEVAAQDMEERLRELGTANVAVPTKWQVTYPDDLFEPDFPVLITDWPDGPAIEVFTTPAGVAAAYPDLPYVQLPMPVLMAFLPDRVGLVFDPGGPAERELRGVPLALYMLYLAEHRPGDADRLLDLVHGSPASGHGDSGVGLGAGA